VKKTSHSNTQPHSNTQHTQHNYTIQWFPLKIELQNPARKYISSSKFVQSSIPCLQVWMYELRNWIQPSTKKGSVQHKRQRVVLKCYQSIFEKKIQQKDSTKRFRKKDSAKKESAEKIRQKAQKIPRTQHTQHGTPMPKTSPKFSEPLRTWLQNFGTSQDLAGKIRITVGWWVGGVGVWVVWSTWSIWLRRTRIDTKP